MDKLSFFITVDQYNNLNQYYISAMNIVDRDNCHIMGYIPVEHNKYDHNLLLGEQVATLTDMWNLWIDRQGIAYFVPWWSHSLVAELCFSSTVDHLEDCGWIHISNGIIVNYVLRKVTDRQYDTLSLYCEHNCRPLFTNII